MGLAWLTVLSLAHSTSYDAMLDHVPYGELVFNCTVPMERRVCAVFRAPQGDIAHVEATIPWRTHDWIAYRVSQCPDECV